jgi:hypothetical protein
MNMIWKNKIAAAIAIGLALAWAGLALGAGGKGASFENALLKLYFNATNQSNLADNTATSPATNLYFTLHTASPTASGSCTSSEAAYTGYMRVAVARSSGGFTVTANSVSPAATVVFPAATGGSETETYFGICLASSGSSVLLYFGSITPTIAVSNGVTPELSTATAITEN